MLSTNKVLFVCIYTGYFLNVLVKRSVTYALPDIGKSADLDKNQMGLILSGQLIGYAASKFISGILMDVVKPQVALFVGLLLQGITAIAFASVDGSVTLFTLFWVMNGLSAGPGWPASVKILKQIFREDQFGTAWSILSTSMNVAGTAGPLLTACIITRFDWRTSIAMPGLCVVVIAPILYLALNYSCRSTDTDSTDKKTDGDKPEMTISRLELLKLPGYGSVLFAYGLISLVQYGTLQWVPVYLVNDLGHTIITGNSYTSSFEIGGITGSLLAGYYSDYLLSKTKNNTPNSVVRLYVVAWFTTGLLTCLMLLTWIISAHSSVFAITIVAFGIGVTIYGPVSILGVAAMECAPDHLSSLAYSVCSLLVSVSQAMAGLPLGFIIKHFGWNLSFYLQLFISLAISVHLFYFTRNFTAVVGDTNKKDQ